MVDHHEDDLTASKTEGFKVGEKKTLQEYQDLGKFYSKGFTFPIHVHPTSLPDDVLTPSPQTRMTKP